MNRVIDIVFIPKPLSQADTYDLADHIRLDVGTGEYIYGDDNMYTIDGITNINDKERRALMVNSYGMGLTPSGSCYYDEDGKLYRLTNCNTSSVELIHDSRKPYDIIEDLLQL